ncbi:hypothetical protein LTR12_010994 [Friedmanniomyces endolithicus]|nr:hypothetical protein LTR12_010994 [Friedmanniomyces endolithicus]
MPDDATLDQAFDHYCQLTHSCRFGERERNCADHLRLMIGHLRVALDAQTWTADQRARKLDLAALQATRLCDQVRQLESTVRAQEGRLRASSAAVTTAPQSHLHAPDELQRRPDLCDVRHATARALQLQPHTGLDRGRFTVDLIAELSQIVASRCTRIERVPLDGSGRPHATPSPAHPPHRQEERAERRQLDESARGKSHAARPPASPLADRRSGCADGTPAPVSSHSSEPGRDAVATQRYGSKLQRRNRTLRRLTQRVCLSALRAGQEAHIEAQRLREAYERAKATCDQQAVEIAAQSRDTVALVEQQAAAVSAASLIRSAYSSTVLLLLERPHYKMRVVRIRPAIGGEEGLERVCFDVETTADGRPLLTGRHEDKPFSFAFEQILTDQRSNSDVNNLLQPLLTAAMDGHTVLIVADGPSKGGKSHTMLKTHDSVIPFAARWIFLWLQDLRTPATPDPTELRIEILEVYRNQIFDLLSSGGGREPLQLQHYTARTRRGKEVRGRMAGTSTSKHPRSADALVGLIRRAHERRRTGLTRMNAESSRSHLVCNIYLTRPGCPDVPRPAIRLVDLAGSERRDDTATNDRQSEAADIAQSRLAVHKAIQDGSGAADHQIPRKPGSQAITKVRGPLGRRS